MAPCDFLGALLTPTALIACNADPTILLSLLGVLLGLIGMSILCWYIAFVTNKAYPKKKPAANAKKGGMAKKGFLRLRG